MLGFEERGLGFPSQGRRFFSGPAVERVAPLFESPSARAAVLVLDRSSTHFAVTARIKIAKTVKTKLAISENRWWCGWARKYLSPDRLKCVRVFMINLLRRSSSRPVFQFLTL
jgi:hypothetical protein